MNLWSPVDWAALFTPTVPLLETFLRGSAVYLGIFVLLRLILKREIGGTNTTDILVLVLLADAASNAMQGEYKSITDGLLLVLTILLWSFAIDALSYRFPRLHRLLYSKPLLLIKDGRPLLRNLRKEFITEEELTSKIRADGLESIAEVHRAYMEPDGEISVIARDRNSSQETHPKHRQPPL